MGQDQSYPSLRLERNSRARKDKPHSVEKSKEIETLKTLRIKTKAEEIMVVVTDDTLTCGWLLSEAIRSYKGPGSIVSLRTAKGLEILDIWLNIFDRSLQPFKDNEKLVAVFEAQVPDQIQLNHFVPLKVIGKGGFSKVVLARKVDTGALYAVKMMSKNFVICEEKVSQILTERSILSRCSNPFIIKLHWAFQSETDLHLVLDFCPGGELFYHLHNIGRLSEDQARFYFCEILLALEYLHSLDIAYRDLKPENVLLDIDGHIRITDFGLSKEFMSKNTLSGSFCGSPEYMSPEMLRGVGHGKEVDFYSIGALLFEMLTGLPPFYDTNRSRMNMKILGKELEIPNYLGRNVKNLILGLLDKDPTQRFGAVNGIDEIKLHPWLRNVDWKKMAAKKAHPPFKPALDRSNIDPEFINLPVDKNEFEKKSTPRASPFEDFDYVSSAPHEKRKDIKLSSVDLNSISTNATRTGFFSRNNSQLRLQSILEDDEPMKVFEEEKIKKKMSGGMEFVKKKKSESGMMSARLSSASEKVENLVFQKKDQVPKQKMHLVKRKS